MQYRVLDKSSSRPIKGVSVNTMELATKSLLYEPVLLDEFATFEVEPYNSNEYAVYLTAPNYKTEIIPYSFLMQQTSGAIYMQREFPTALAIVALIAIYTYTKKHNKVGKLDQQDIKNIMLATGGLIAFSLIKQLLEFLGIWQDREGQQLDDAATNPNSFWNPNFWRTKPDYVSWTAPITDTEAQATAKAIYNAISATGDDEELIKGIFRQFRAQSTVSYVAAWFLQLYQKDLLAFLRGGWWPFEALNDTDLAEINSFISKLPKY